ncbi:hypothetical protein EMPS_05380 [Entomortierella parvispora]|uniref:Methyltransferase FkbM domain-containing protein n=1 Tax=Entomortierella parvispora TaxID=205924 RepID=A0A9P3HB08_9FUNG|nr:hypothetical protein EMPS_05380 [Entomortierella parvispora]
MAPLRNVIFPAALILSALFLLLTLRHSAMTRTEPKPRFVFVDLGANRADSMEAFLKISNSKFQFDYPRPAWAKHEDAEIFLFEANPVFNTDLVKAKDKYTARGIKVNIFPSTVVDVQDGIRTFFLDTVNKDHDFWGSSIYAEHWDAVASGLKGTNLTSINLAGWLLRNFLPRDYVVIKMDIEGAEYEVVPHLAEMGAGIVVDQLLVEWHPSIMVGDEEQQKIRELKRQISTRKLMEEGVLMPAYDTPMA